MTEQNNPLKVGTSLMIIVKSTTNDEKLRAYLYKCLNNILEAKERLFVELILKENLQLKHNSGNLQDCTCYIPALQKDAKSVNHAATLISEHYELNRKSHTKDVFREAYFQDIDYTWKPLKIWREKVNPRFAESRNIREITARLNHTADNPSDFN